MKGMIFSVLGLAAVVAFLAPHTSGDTSQASSSSSSPSSVMVVGHGDPHIAKSDKPAWYGGAMVLDRQGDGHFYADVQIDTGDYHMLVDTGASVVALTGDDAHNIGLDWDPDALAPVARGASGPVMGVPVTIAQMSVGDFEAHNVQAVIIPDGLAVSLLGQSFLRNVKNVTIADDTLTLSN